MRTKLAQKFLAKIADDYDHIAEEFDQTRQSDWKEFADFLKYIKHGDSVADLGCGNGRFYKFIPTSKKIKYTGVDFSQKLLEKAQKNFPQTKFIHGDLQNLHLKNGNFDVALAIASLHHLPSKSLRQKAVLEMKRILAKNGILIVTCWNLFQPKYRKYIWRSRLKALLSFSRFSMRDTFIPWGNSGIKRYYYAFKASELKKLLEKNGFKILKFSQNNNLVFICRKK